MRKFKTESKKLLDLMINSIYTNKEIFLRELISNASDATDKLYFKSLTDTSIQLSRDDLAIRVTADPATRTLIISDGGIGMDADELEKNLGTIAHSGSLEFKTAQAAKNAPEAVEGEEDGSREVEETVTNLDDVDIIGQFGVGFYSAFMVASKVKVVSKPYGSDQAHVWESTGVEGYNITEGKKEGHGTDVILTIKPATGDDDYDFFLTEEGLRYLITKYSDYIRYPIQMMVTKTRMKPAPEDATEDYKPEYEEYQELETINSMIPIWKRRKSEVTQEEYNDFYKSNFYDRVDPERTISIHTEGKLSYDALLYIPAEPPYDLYTKNYQKGLSLYSSGVMIMEKCEDLLPDCFNFVKGVVDSDDLTLNISRETLQHDAQLRAIERRIEKKIKSELVSMRDGDREAYEKFFKNFGRGIKFALYSEYGMQSELLGDLLLFYSAKEQKMVTLDEYLENAPKDIAEDGSEKPGTIFYAAGDSVERLSKMPIVESVITKGHDVLLCTMDVDEFCLQALHEYHGCGFKNVAGGDLGLDSEEEKTAAEEASRENLGLLAAMEEALEEEVSKVIISTRLTDAPVCITAEGPVSLEMEKRFAGIDDAGEVKSERVLELNAKNPIFDVLKAAWEADDRDKINRYTKILYNQALLIEGLSIDDPTGFAKDICALMI